MYCEKINDKVIVIGKSISEVDKIKRKIKRDLKKKPSKVEAREVDNINYDDIPF